jgi:hypothetical protein
MLQVVVYQLFKEIIKSFILQKKDLDWEDCLLDILDKLNFLLSFAEVYGSLKFHLHFIPLFLKIFM